MSSARPQLKRIYGSQSGRPRLLTSSYSSDTSLSSLPTRETGSTLSKRKRPLSELFSNADPPAKKVALKKPATAVKAKAKDKKKAVVLTQLHFSIDQSILRTCSLCDLSYTHGAPDDESLHKVHCARVQKGVEWGRDEEKERNKAGGDVVVVEEDATLKSGEIGRIVAVKANVGGKVGHKVSAYLKTVNLALSAPDMTTLSLEASKAYLFLLRTPGSTREKIVGCLLAQRILTAMKVATQEEVSMLQNTSPSLIHVEGNLYCKPQRFPTPMGVPRLFVSSAHRRKGIAESLLIAAAKTFIHGCELDPAKGEVAFSQPTSMGRTVMEKCSKGDDERSPALHRRSRQHRVMYGRQSRRVRSLLRTRASSRSSATASALKPAHQTVGKWEISQASSSISQKPPQVKANLGKWALPSQPAPAPTSARQAAGSYNPNFNRWVRPKASEPSHKSILGDLDVSRSPSRSPRLFNSRNRSQTRNGGSLQQIPKFPSDSQRKPKEKGESTGKGSSFGLRLDRDTLPHLSADGQNLPDRQEEASRSPQVSARERNLRRELQPEPEDVMRYVERPARDRARYVEDLAPTERFEGRGDGERFRRGQRDSFKSRGSVVERLRLGQSIEIPKHSRVHEDRMDAAKKAKKAKEIKPVSLDINIPSIISVGNLARLLGVRLETLQKCMRRNDMEEQSSYDHMLSTDDASLLAMEFGKNPVVDDEAAFDIYASPPHPDYASLPRRPPVVTIMGHVDHGKTTLLDTLRSSSVAKGEAGGITQHIGAFSVLVPNVSDASDIPRTITFLDTPGHAAFSAMRARGAQVTDIIVLVVAADDGVMPQTREVIDLIKKDREKVGVVVAINKVDKPGAHVEGVQNALWAEGVELEAMGGDIPSVEVSGLTGHGLDQLVETISLLAELQELRAETDGPAHGYVLESKVKKGFGNTATVLLLRGKLTPASHIISGTTFAKIRQLTDSTGKTVKAASPGSAVMVSGWKELPSAGDEVLQGKETDVKRAVDNRLRKASLEATINDAEAINASRRQDREEREKKLEEEPGELMRAAPKATGPKELRLVIKGDVSGSIEALAAAVESIGNKSAITKVVSTGVGEVTESDVMLAKAAEAMVIAFSVNVSRMADQAASQNGVTVYSSKIIYSVLDEVKEQVIKLLPPIVERRVTGEANVLQMFDINGKGKSIIKVAGCRVSNGIVDKGKRVRVLRNGETVHEGTLGNLRILKRDVMEVKKGLECGINLTNFDDLRNGDFLQFYQEIEKPGQL